MLIMAIWYVANLTLLNDLSFDCGKNKKKIIKNISFQVSVSLEYCEELHTDHNDFPFCAIHRTNEDGTSKKLMLTLENKDEYVMHYQMFKLALAHGLKLKKLHKVLKFYQSPFLKPYIELNTRERQKATSAFEKDLYKGANNYVYGKCVENIRNHVDIKLSNKWHGRYGCKSLISSPNFKRSVIFDENFVSVELTKTNVYYNKSIAVGAAILSISKLKMYSFLYEFLKPKLKDDLTILYTDTDAFIMEVKNVDMYEFMKENIDEFDTSDYPQNNLYNMPLVNAKVIGRWKDETAGRPITSN